MTRVSLGRQLQRIREPSMARSCHKLSMFVVGANLETTCSLAYTDRDTHLSRDLSVETTYMIQHSLSSPWSSFQSNVVSGRPCPSMARDVRIAPLIRRQGHIAGLAWDLAVNNSVSGRLGRNAASPRQIDDHPPRALLRDTSYTVEKIYTPVPLGRC